MDAGVRAKQEPEPNIFSIGVHQESDSFAARYSTRCVLGICLITGGRRIFAPQQIILTLVI